jgi:hypothetical protein
MRFEKIFLLYPCYAGQAHRHMRTSLVRRITNLVAKKLHSILNNDKGNLNNNLNFCRFLFQEDLIELAYKCFSPSQGEVRRPLTAKY